MLIGVLSRASILFIMAYANAKRVCVHITTTVQSEIEKRKRELAARRADLKNAWTEYDKQVMSEFEYGTKISDEKLVVIYLRVFS